MYIIFDPGPVTGWCKFNNRGQELEMGQVPLHELPMLIEEWPTVAVRRILCEDWVLIPRKIGAQIGRQSKAKIPTIEAIGVIKGWARRKKVPITMVQPHALVAAQKWTQVKLPADHDNSHQIAAFLHGAKWLIDQGLRPTALDMQYANKQEERTGVSNTSEADGRARSDG